MVGTAPEFKNRQSLKIGIFFSIESWSVGPVKCQEMVVSKRTSAALHCRLLVVLHYHCNYIWVVDREQHSHP